MSMKQNITITVEATVFGVVKDFYRPFFVDFKGEYVDFQARRNGVVITGYSTKKERKKITFNGENAFEEARIWSPDIEMPEPKVKEKEKWIAFNDQIGSDEVGVGDFLGPMIVVAAYVNKKDINKLISFGIHDSKKMTDARIKEIGPKIVKEFNFSKLTLSNQKYNELLDKGENLNSMKAKMHNRALLNMHKKYPDVDDVYVDQFVAPEKYYEYLNDDSEEKVTGITFKTKGESSFPCVALASVIARYSYLLEMDLLSKKYGIDFPYGASSKVTEFARKFLKKYSEKELYKVAKKNFANYREVISE